MNTFEIGAEPEEVPVRREPLLVELVPQTSWGDNLRLRLPAGRWDSLRREQYRRADFRCEICGERGTAQGFNWPVECHEVWRYDDSCGLQTLERLIALCPLCHKVKHIGRTATVDGPEGLEDALHRLMTVNGWSLEQAEEHVRLAFAQWERRSLVPWVVDLTVIGMGSSVQVGE